MEERLSQQAKFLRDQYAAAKPLIEDNQLMEMLRAEVDPLLVAQFKDRIEMAIEKFKTRIYRYEKEPGRCHPDAKRVLIEAADTLEYASTLAIIKALKQDPRCRSICFIADKAAQKNFFAQPDPDFKELKAIETVGQSEAPLLTTISGPFDIAIASIESKNSPNSTVLFSAKQVFDAKKLFLIINGWSGVAGENLGVEQLLLTMGDIDGIICNDGLARDIIHSQLPSVPVERLYDIGTPVIDALEVERAAEYRARGRKKLSLDGATLAVLFVGGISTGLREAGFKTDEYVDEKTYFKTRGALIKLAQERPDTAIALLIRPHPADPNKEMKLASYTGELPPNLKIIPATKEIVTMQEAAYAADVVATVNSTEVFFAPNRGKTALLLGYRDEPGLGGAILDKLYSPDLLEQVGQTKGISIVTSPEQAADRLGDYLDTNVKPAAQTLDMTPRGRSVDRILELIFSD